MASNKVWTWLVILSLFFSYVCIHFPKTAFPVAADPLSPILNDQYSTLMSVSNGFHFLGKMLVIVVSSVSQSRSSNSSSSSSSSSRFHLMGVFSLLFSLLGSAICLLLCSFVSQAWMLYVLKSATTVFTAICWPSVVAITHRWIQPEHYGRSMGIVSLSMPIGDAISRLVQGWLMDLMMDDWRAVFQWSAVCCGLGVLPILLFVRDQPWDSLSSDIVVVKHHCESHGISKPENRQSINTQVTQQAGNAAGSTSSAYPSESPSDTIDQGYTANYNDLDLSGTDESSINDRKITASVSSRIEFNDDDNRESKMGYNHESSENESALMSIFSTSKILFSNTLFLYLFALAFQFCAVREMNNTYLKSFIKSSIPGMSNATATKLSAVFPLTGVISVLYVGWHYDHFKPASHNYTRLMVFPICSVLLLLLGTGPQLLITSVTIYNSTLNMIIVVCMICFYGITLMGPVSLVLGTLPLELVHRTGLLNHTSTITAWLDVSSNLAAIFITVSKWILQSEFWMCIIANILAVSSIITGVILLFQMGLNHNITETNSSNSEIQSKYNNNDDHRFDRHRQPSQLNTPDLQLL